MMKLYRPYIIYVAVFISLILSSCSVKEPVADKNLDVLPAIYPDYVGVTIPCNIAPLRFKMADCGNGDAIAVIGSGDGKITVKADGGKFLIGEGDWQGLLSKSVGDSIEVKVYVQNEGKWEAYKPFCWYVSEDPIDPWLVYRLIEPGYELWNKMGIYQRDLTSFTQEPVIINSQTKGNCMNCHSFCMQDPGRMTFNMRAELGGTYLLDNEGVAKKINPSNSKRTLVYPYWHPSGRYVAYSCNDIRQAFHLNHKNRVEVFDTASDVVVYDIKENKVITDTLLHSKSAFETFPAFSPDGGKLYFCSAQARDVTEEYDKVKYSLCSVSFNVADGTFGTKVDTLFNAVKEDKSVSFPRVSPDGRFLAFTLSGYGNFSIWHKDADLYLIDLQSGMKQYMQGANSDDVESYHSWSSNSKWMVFSSRRMDGLYTSPYFVHIDDGGNCSKAFVLPQEDPGFYEDFMFSFNIPELVKEKAKVSLR